MDLEQSFYAHWAATPGLESLLPARRVRTGLAHGERRPYATLERRAGRTAFRTNAGDALDEVTLAIHVWHDSYDAGRAIVGAIRAAFDRSDFDLGGGDRVLQIRRTAEAAKQQDNNVWQFTVEFSVSVYLSSGV
jgi:hypothetical protein